MSATVRKMKMTELHAENERLRDERNATIRTNAELLQTIAALEAERNAWREDADAMVARSNHQPSCEIFKPLGLTCTCGWSQAMNNHIQLHERYSTEKSDTAKGE